MIDLRRQFLVGGLNVFTLKSLLERLKRDFDDSKIVSVQFKRRFLISTCYFAHLDGSSAENMNPDFLRFTRDRIRLISTFSSVTLRSHFTTFSMVRFNQVL